jgi:hypothetical protein
MAHIAAMNLIYKGATMTLIVAEADNAFSGLPGVRPHPQLRERIVERVGIIRLATVSEIYSHSSAFSTPQTTRIPHVCFRCLLEM